MVTIEELQQIKPRTTPQKLQIGRVAIEYYLHKCHGAVNDLFCLVVRFLGKKDVQEKYLASFPFVLNPVVIQTTKEYELWDSILFQYERGGGRDKRFIRTLKSLIQI